MMSLNCDRLATDTDMRTDNGSAKTQASSNAHGCIVHFQSDTGEWQRMEPVTGPRRTRRDESGPLDVVSCIIQECFGLYLATHVIPFTLRI